MPISANYSWEETEQDVTVTLPFRGKSAKKMDLFIADCVLKVSHPPFLLDLNLYNYIEPKSCKAVLREGSLIIRFQKVATGMWHTLVYKGTKEESRKRRKQSLQRREEDIQRLHEKARSKRLEEERMVLRKQIDLEKAENQYIDDLKDKEKKEAEEILYQSIEVWDKRTHIEDERNNDNGNDGQNITSKAEKDVHKPNQNDTFYSNSHITPPVRSANYVRFKHTPRVFKTPIRESTILREKEFLVKNRPYLRNNKYLNNETSSDVGDTDPTWLKRKGDEFYEARDYLSAINAYSEAFERDDQFFQVLSNRSLCYFTIGEVERSICDGEEALKIIRNRIINDKTIDTNQLIKIQRKLLIRISNAYCQSGSDLSQYKIALEYLDEASSLTDTEDPILSYDAERVKTIYKAMKLKFKGDFLFADDNIDAAISYYKKALLVETTLLDAKINCITAYLVNGDFQECVELAGEILDDLKNTGPCQQHESNLPPVGTIPLAGTDRRRKITIATLCKRAEANTCLENFPKALEDLELANVVGQFYETEFNIDQGMNFLKSKINENVEQY